MPAARHAAPAPHETESPRLFSFEFIAICAISVLAFCNISIFYGFYSYLTELGVPPVWRGPLLALEPLTALLLRPFLGRYLALGNAVRFMRAGMALATLALLCYPLAHSIPALACVRVLHGLGFVTVVTGLMGTLMAFLPKRQSAQGFGLFSVTILLPYAIMPPFVETLLPHLESHGHAYALAAPLMLPAFLLLMPLGKRVAALAASLPPSHLERPGWDEVRQSFRSLGVALLVVANFFLVAAHAIVFFFMRDFAAAIGAGNPGAFFTCANAATISVRVLGGPMLDRLNKGRALALAFLGMGLLVPLFAHAGGFATLLGMAALYGTGMALTMPLINSCMLDISPPRLRAYNANLLMIAVDAGFFVGPFLGGAIMAGEWGHTVLFGVAGGLMLLAAACVRPVGRAPRQGTPHP
ncbi:Predicted arabinose efflux permease, MFS family [Humidesulfovibrio mexicanus]|uniref:Predicted arabinose efflux permease, MFS family n=1 Tax=Humidesulfovibrio mexicanus TaxID=147047 RepID=A0A239BL79_9BACT|nr:MFS transporter [Humidesulfovibrio mexicanus]SNS07784.1 Predicted arabinose efflux permease, MFS family [Humidesulfovibrio mexicanus]